MDCLACGRKLELLGNRPGGSYGSCSGCGGVQLLDIPSQEKLDALYRQDYSCAGHYVADYQRQKAERGRVIEQLVELCQAEWQAPRSARILELGAGWGALGDALSERGFDYRGLEPSANMSEAARERGLQVKTGDLRRAEELLGTEATFDLIVSMAVLEHMRDPVDALRRMGSLLRPTGKIVAQLPTAGIPRTTGPLLRSLLPGGALPAYFGSLAPPWHVHLPSPQGMSEMARRAGLEVSRVVVSRSGRGRGLRSVLQASTELLGRGGALLFGPGWPLAVAHVFVLRKAPAS